MDTENLKLTQKVGRPKKYFTEQEEQEIAKKQRGEAKKRQRLYPPYIRCYLTLPLNPYIAASASFIVIVGSVSIIQ
ncbi:MAG: hypothetical protein EZS28_016619 [Streblomastix strix]|uniref:Uncharacterized protein n=1 Tax=Streblomastix strix TaxID=222440 RepID=A0A5J4W010_9EUKA|nr:MAG: hypothetical protein EZS28_016619 [Streblomastix strix]